METHSSSHSSFIGGVLRIALGWLFFWAFIDKLFGLGYATVASKSWLNGISPTYGFLKMGSKGPFQGLFQTIAGTAIVDWLFMLGLLGIGFALLFGVAIRFAAVCGTVLVLLMWLVVLPPAQNPLIDDHIIYALILAFIAINPLLFSRLSTYGEWTRMSIVKKFPILK